MSTNLITGSSASYFPTLANLSKIDLSLANVGKLTSVNDEMIQNQLFVKNKTRNLSEKTQKKLLKDFKNRNPIVTKKMRKRLKTESSYVTNTPFIRHLTHKLE